ncbi:zinc finger protein 64 [Lates japonicus]|uniref:Zinc finger protein 64 n=1 Tax=Lates japonicus TaxID=270547 RepID=A0AAD3NN85_LATJO|nr:zinc finger protein 64 [Lates japonicus]
MTQVLPSTIQGDAYRMRAVPRRFSVGRDKLTMHSRSHTGEKPHKCKHCPYAAADSSLAHLGVIHTMMNVAA